MPAKKKASKKAKKKAAPVVVPPPQVPNILVINGAAYLSSGFICDNLRVLGKRKEGTCATAAMALELMAGQAIMEQKR